MEAAAGCAIMAVEERAWQALRGQRALAFACLLSSDHRHRESGFVERY